VRSKAQPIIHRQSRQEPWYATDQDTAAGDHHGIWRGGSVVAQEVVVQEATPTAGGGLAFEYIGGGTVETLPQAPVRFEMLRIGFEPGSSFPIEADDPSITLALVEQGEITFQVDAPVSVFHATDMSEEVVPADEAFTLEVGDSALFPPSIAGVIGNEGAIAASVLLSNIGPVDDGGGAATPVT
jgi:quercetin dioxygenase-like cupin family protein